MNAKRFEALSHIVTRERNRRGLAPTLMGLAAGGLLPALAGPTVASAGKAGKRATKACRRQKGGCEEVVKAQCAGNATCLNALLPCCAALGRCQGREATTCLLSGAA